MGAPELPNDPGDDDVQITHIVHHPPAPSDDSENESLADGGTYDGYQPLAVDENYTDYDQTQFEYDGDDNNGSTTEVYGTTYEHRVLDENQQAEELRGDSNMPQIETIDVEVEREVWSQPRPRELQIELDGNKTQQILSAMANFQLPNLAVPEWATGVPEERWKEELLQRIRQRKPSDISPKMEVGKEQK